MSPFSKSFQLRNPALLVLVLLLQFAWSHGQTLTQDRAVDWSLAGYRDQIPTEFSSILNINNFGGQNDGLADNSDAFQLALSALDAEGGVIFFPAGSYFFTSPISLPDGVVLRGEGSDHTSLVFDLGGTGDLISVNGYGTNIFTAVETSISKTDSFVEVENAQDFIAGDYIRLVQNDSSLVLSDWAIGCVGQIAKVIAIDGNILVIDSEWRRNYDLSHQPVIQKLEMRKNVGIECLKIERLDETNPSQTSNIKFQNAAQCWVRGVESTQCNFAHVDIRASSNISLTGNYFHHAFDYGGGGRAYGIMIQSTGNEVLVENNVFEHLRHSMIVQSGANGNVFAYNYSFDPFWTGTSFPSNAAGDLVCHGNFPYSNLFEGNIGQQIVIDNSHGANGPYNTFFRNRVESYGIVMSADNSPSQNFLGNEISNGTPGAVGFYFLQGSDHFEIGNNLGGEITPVDAGVLTDHSCYLDSIPSFLTQELFPSIGTPNVINSGSIPALNRWLDDNGITICANECQDEDADEICDSLDNCISTNNTDQSDNDLDGIGNLCDNCPDDANEDQEDLNGNGIGDICEQITTTTKITHTENNWKIYPNPANNLLILEFENSFESNTLVQVYSTLGQLMLEQETSNRNTALSVNSFPNGNYIIHILSGNKESASKLFTISRE